jgi:hypothetical protein
VLGEAAQHDVDRALPVVDVGIADVGEDAPLDASWTNAGARECNGTITGQAAAPAGEAAMLRDSRLGQRRVNDRHVGCGSRLCGASRLQSGGASSRALRPRCTWGVTRNSEAHLAGSLSAGGHRARTARGRLACQRRSASVRYPAVVSDLGLEDEVLHDDPLVGVRGAGERAHRAPGDRLDRRDELIGGGDLKEHT